MVLRTRGPMAGKFVNFVPQEDFEDTKFASFVPIYDIQCTKEVFIRTVGYAKGIDLVNDLVTLEYNEDTVLIDVRYIQPLKFKQGAILQIIGDLEIQRGRTERVVLKAQLYRNIDGLDMMLYHEMQKMRAKT